MSLLYECHVGPVIASLPGLKNACVTAIPILVPLNMLSEQLVHSFIRPQDLPCFPPGIDAALQRSSISLLPGNTSLTTPKLQSCKPCSLHCYPVAGHASSDKLIGCHGLGLQLVDPHPCQSGESVAQQPEHLPQHLPLC